jgi:hypothetical protein
MVDSCWQPKTEYVESTQLWAYRISRNELIIRVTYSSMFPIKCAQANNS